MRQRTDGTDAADERLGGGDPLVARPHNDVARVHAAHTVRHRGDRLHSRPRAQGALSASISGTFDKEVDPKLLCEPRGGMHSRTLVFQTYLSTANGQEAVSVGNERGSERHGRWAGRSTPHLLHT